MKFQRIQSINDPLFKKSWEIYCSNFPLEERRDLIEQKRIFENYSCDKLNINNKYEYVFESLTKDGSAIGIVAYWLFPNSIFIEHIAISSNMQGLGIGKIAIDHIKDIYNNYNKPIILEIEIPNCYITKRRESFYKKLDFKENSHDHVQPIYHIADEPIEMVIMSWPHAINEDTYLEFKDYQLEIMPSF